MDSSKNEILIAIFLGILIGFISVLSFYFIYKNRSKYLPKTQKTSVSLNTKTKSSDNSGQNIFENFDLTVDPEDDNVVSQTNMFTIKGQTDKKAIVIVQTDDNAIRVTPDSNGNFSTEVNLQPEINQVFISAILDSTQEKTIEKIIYYEKK
jgi:hypothetical protein